MQPDAPFSPVRCTASVRSISHKAMPVEVFAVVRLVVASQRPCCTRGLMQFHPADLSIQLLLPFVAQGQSLDSSFFRLPLRFARQQLPQLGALKRNEACNIPADLLLLPPGLREPRLATSKVSLAGGLCVVRYEFMKQGTLTKFEYRSHGFISSHMTCKQLCQDGWFLVGKALPRASFMISCENVDQYAKTHVLPSTQLLRPAHTQAVTKACQHSQLCYDR